MRKWILAAIVMLAAACSSPRKMGTAVPVAQPMFQVIPAGLDPNAARIGGASGNIVQNAQPDGRSWALAPGGVWQAFPGSGGGGVVADGGVTAPLKCTGDAGFCGTPTNPLALDPAATDAWSLSVNATIKALVPGLTRCEYIKAPTIVVSGVGVSVNVEGGGVGVASDTTHYKTFVQSSVWNAPRTSLMGVGFRVKFPAIATGKTSLVSICDAGGGGIIGFGWDQGTNATKWQLFPSGGSNVASAFAADTLEHTFVITSNAVTISGVIDGTIAATSTAVSTLPNNPALPSSFSSASLTPGVIVSRIYYCYVDPT